MESNKKSLLDIKILIFLWIFLLNLGHLKIFIFFRGKSLSLESKIFDLYKTSMLALSNKQQWDEFWKNLQFLLRIKLPFWYFLGYCDAICRPNKKLKRKSKIMFFYLVEMLRMLRNELHKEIKTSYWT